MLFIFCSSTVITYFVDLEIRCWNTMGHGAATKINLVKRRCNHSAFCNYDTPFGAMLYDRPGCIEVNIADSSKCAGDNDFVATRQVKLGDHKLGQWAAVRGLEILAHFACHRWSCIQMLVKGEKIHTYNWPSSEIIGI